MSTILVIDNSPDSLRLIQAALKDPSRVQVASSEAQALQIALSEAPPDLILLDVGTPDNGGHAVCRRLQAEALAQDIAVQCLVASSPQTYEAEIAKRTQALTAVQNVTILAMASLAETRDADTGNHLRRTQRYVRALAWKLSSHPKFSAILTPTNVGLLYRSAPLHELAAFLLSSAPASTVRSLGLSMRLDLSKLSNWAVRRLWFAPPCSRHSSSQGVGTSISVG